MNHVWIVAFDFTDGARRALEVAHGLLDRLGGGTLIAAYVMTPDAATADFIEPWGERPDEEAPSARAQRRLTATLDALRSDTVTTRAWIGEGHVAETLGALAEVEHAEQIVCGSHGRRGLAHFFLGSVAEKIVMTAQCSVMVVKPLKPS